MGINKEYYKYSDYLEDLNLIEPIMENIDHIVAIYRGSLPMGVHLSNLYDVPLSIIDYQSRDGESAKPTWMKNRLAETNVPFKKVLVLDDIYDSGKTMYEIKTSLENGQNHSDMPQPKFHYLTIYGKENDNDVNYLREHTGEWIEFWWEFLEETK